MCRLKPFAGRKVAAQSCGRKVAAAKLRRKHAAQTCGTNMRHKHAAQHAAQTCGTNMRHAAQTCGIQTCGAYVYRCLRGGIIPDSLFMGIIAMVGIRVMSKVSCSATFISDSV
jgi:hypothetical protein